MTKWIKCSEKLPDDGKRYPVLIDGEILNIGTLTMQKTWLDDQFGEIFPTHWTNIDENPKDEE